jgi:hypothetical protein
MVAVAVGAGVVEIVTDSSISSALIRRRIQVLRQFQVWSAFPVSGSMRAQALQEKRLCIRLRDY